MNPTTYLSLNFSNRNFKNSITVIKKLTILYKFFFCSSTIKKTHNINNHQASNIKLHYQ